MILFAWDPAKEVFNLLKHRVSFTEAKLAFDDPHRKIYFDEKHSSHEERFFCVGKIGDRVMTVRFSYRHDQVRIIGAGYWRKGRRLYEKKDD